jgi:hypothetical protein
MKDVRRADGWIVNVELGSEFAAVTHRRWEQNLQPETSPEHFEVCWEMRVSFDSHVTRPTAVDLRIRQVRCHQDMKPELRKKIEDTLRGNVFCTHGYIL